MSVGNWSSHSILDCQRKVLYGFEFFGGWQETQPERSKTLVLSLVTFHLIERSPLDSKSICGTWTSVLDDGKSLDGVTVISVFLTLHLLLHFLTVSTCSWILANPFFYVWLTLFHWSNRAACNFSALKIKEQLVRKLNVSDRKVGSTKKEIKSRITAFYILFIHWQKNLNLCREAKSFIQGNLALSLCFICQTWTLWKINECIV